MVSRQPKGVPTGGQFAASAHDEASAALGGTVPVQDERLHIAGFMSESQADDVLWSLDKYSETGDDAMYERARSAFGDDDAFQAVFEHHQDSIATPFDEGDKWTRRRELVSDIRDIYASWRGHDEDKFREPSFGERADEARGKPVTEVNKMLRKEFKKASDSGYLPDGISVRVFKHNGEPRVEVSGVSPEQRLRGYRDGEDYTNTPERMRERPEYVELRRRVEAIAMTFAVDKTDHDSHDPVYLTWNKPIVQFA